ncbi:MAG: hypothetical protein WD696_11645 [Bryobacteraceae bacterium]
MSNPIAFWLSEIAGLALLAAAYGFHSRKKTNFAACALFFGLVAFVFPWIAVFGPLAAPEPAAAAGATQYQVDLLNQLQVDLLRSRVVAQTPGDAKRLERHEATVFSQSGQDGIIAEIFRRIGAESRYFVEFGSADGSENNTVLLLMGGWSGLWMEGAEAHASSAASKFKTQIREGRLNVRHAFVTAENIEDLLRSANVPRSFDLLTIDIDRNDYWVWQAIQSYSPRVVVIEYNAIYPPGISWVVNYEPRSSWDGTSHFGASLTALEALGREKGYSLVGCNLTGSDAFFVRNDLVGSRFAPPFTAENHYQPPRYYMVWYKGGHPRRVAVPGRVELMPKR